MTPSSNELHVDALEDCARPAWNQGQLPEWAFRTAIDHSESSTGFTDAVISAGSVPFDKQFRLPLCHYQPSVVLHEVHHTIGPDFAP